MDSAFPREVERLADLVRNASLDVEALSRPLKRCDLAKCHGTCCHDGVYVSSEEGDVIRDLANTRRDEFAEIGINDLPEKVIVYGKFQGVASGPKTATREVPMSELVDDYPTHFPNTNCVFLLPDAKCALQMLSIKEGKQPWYYKPFTCWIHPLAFSHDENWKPVLTLHGPDDDPHTFPDYDGFSSKTHCGRPCGDLDAQPGYEVLSMELEALGKIGGRDLMGEIRGLI